MVLPASGASEVSEKTLANNDFFSSLSIVAK
jgi:hypothetical protein